MKLAEFREELQGDAGKAALTFQAPVSSLWGTAGLVDRSKLSCVPLTLASVPSWRDIAFILKIKRGQVCTYRQLGRGNCRGCPESAE